MLSLARFPSCTQHTSPAVVPCCCLACLSEVPLCPWRHGWWAAWKSRSSALMCRPAVRDETILTFTEVRGAMVTLEWCCLSLPSSKHKILVLIDTENIKCSYMFKYIFLKYKVKTIVPGIWKCGNMSHHHHACPAACQVVNTAAAVTSRCTYGSRCAVLVCLAATRRSVFNRCVATLYCWQVIM